MSRHGQPELEIPLRLRAPIAWQDHQLTTTNGHQRCVDRREVPELWKPDTAKKRLPVQR